MILGLVITNTFEQYSHILLLTLLLCAFMHPSYDRRTKTLAKQTVEHLPATPSQLTQPYTNEDRHLPYHN